MDNFAVKLTYKSQNINNIFSFPFEQINLADFLICPVCMMTYENRIMQCSQGHSVCERCYSLLTQCPTCRSIFTGARNYALEDVVAKINNTEKKKSFEFTYYQEALAEIRQRKRKRVGPVQTPGHFRCRIAPCLALLPVCRLLNHVRYHHSRQLTESRSTFMDQELQFFEQWKLPLRSMHRALQITRVGLFFIIMEVEMDKSRDDCKVSAWVEAVCSSGDARTFRFGCDFVCGQSVASYSDVVSLL